MGSSRGGQIDVAKPIVVDRSFVSYELSCSSEIRRYFSSRAMFVSYDADVSLAPSALLLIPLLSSLAPIAWALGADINLPCIDVRFLRALGEIRQSFRRLYPDGDWSGEVRADQIVDTSPSYQGTGNAILFSGGVDSVTSVVLHKEEKPRLVTVWGADLGLAQHHLWDQVSAANRTFARNKSVEISFIKTNFRTFFNSYRLNATSPQRFSNWYSGFQQGLGLVGLCAPLSYIAELGSIYIPSTHTADFGRPWGSHPEIDNNVRWGSTKAIHDGYEMSRQTKLQVLAKHIREEDSRLPLRVCWGKGANCSRCGKCCITMAGLALEGLDPNNHGFRFSSGTLPYFRRQLETGRFQVSDTALWLLMEIQTRSVTRPYRLKVDGVDEFFTWLQSADVRALKEKSEHSVSKAVKALIETTPEPIGRAFRKVMGHPFP